MKKLNILFLRSNPIDPDSRVEKEMNALLDANHNVTALAWDRSENYKYKKDDLILKDYTTAITRTGIKCPFGGTPLQMILPLIKFQLRIIKYIIKNKNNIDVIHACDFDTAFTSIVIAKILKIKIVYDIFDYYVETFDLPSFSKPLVKAMDKWCIKKADTVIICNDERYNQIPSKVAKRIEVIHNAPSFNVNPYTRPIDNKFKIAYFGILQPGRLIEELCEVVSELDNNVFELHIGGFGVLESKVDTISKKASNLTFYGKVDYEFVLSIEQNCDIITAIYDPSIPNHKYAAPNKFYEAMYLNKPLIVCHDTCIDKIVKELNCGEIINCNKNDLKEAIINLYNKREEFESIKTHMSKYYNENLTWDISKNRLIKLYRELK